MSAHQDNEGHVPLNTFGVGASVVVKGRLYEVMELRPTGDVLLQDSITGSRRWADYYVCRVINPNEEPGAVLDAMGTILDDDE